MSDRMARDSGVLPGAASRPRVALAALGVKLRHLDLFAPVRSLVKIDQKTITDRPDQKLHTAEVPILEGVKRMTAVNTLVRAATLLHKACGAVAGTDQSGVLSTLDAGTATNVEHLQQAVTRLFRRHSPAYPHPYPQAWQLRAVAMTGVPCGKKAVAATTG